MQKLTAFITALMLAVYPALAVPALPTFRWETTPVGDSAELHTLLRTDQATETDTPVVAVLRDTLGDPNTDNDRLVYVWLLDYSPLNWHQRLLAAVPFFYWRVGRGSNQPEKGRVRPLLNLSAPIRPMLNHANRQLVQWTLFDPMATEVRATTRAYTENETDHERIRIEETISYLNEAPVTRDASGLSKEDVDLLMARLSLREQALGGLVTDTQASHIGDQERISAERIRLRNWEYLRGASERAGLIFEPLKLSGTAENYAIVWYRPGSSAPPVSSTDDGPVWRILNIQNPWKDARLRNWKGLTVTRDVNGPSQELIPLAAYSLTYPRMPLLMIDFRSEARLRRHEMLQRGIDQLVSGVLGLSHFANWYYFAGADAYSFVANRRGATLNRNARLDSYAQLRSELALDSSLPPALRSAMQERLGSLEMNPLDASPEAEVQTARARYAKLQEEAGDGELLKQLNLERREEVAEFGKGGGHLALDAGLHATSFGLYTHRAPSSPDLLSTLDRERRLESELDFLDGVVKTGPTPEISFDSSRIAASVQDVAALLPEVHSDRVLRHAESDLRHLQESTEDETLRADCGVALQASSFRLHTGIAARPRVFADPHLEPEK